MGKKSKAKAGLGRALINERSRRAPQEQKLQQFMTDPSIESKGNGLKSVTEQNDLEAFLTDAVLAGSEFVAQRDHAAIVPDASTLRKLEEAGALPADQQFHEVLGGWVDKVRVEDGDAERASQIPRRPEWDAMTTAAQLDANEREAFLNWRRDLATLEERTRMVVTPFEKNLEVWRQLWRVVERSDVVVQVVDARNPELFRSRDLEDYALEVDSSKKNLLLINKADFLTVELRQAWKEHLTAKGVDFAFFSAVLEQNKIDGVPNDPHINDLGVLDKEGLLALLESYKPQHKERVVVGLVGFPNVGKSSTINVLVGAKKVGVSSTPGKTKHFQTLILTPTMTLCDCPGLVFPRMASSKAELVLDGVLPIDQLRNHVPPCQLLCDRIPRDVMEGLYGVVLPRPAAGQDPNRGLLATELLGAYAGMRGFMTSRGLPDEARAARIVLKDYVNGELLYCHFPSTHAQSAHVGAGAAQPSLEAVHHLGTTVKRQRTKKAPQAPGPKFDDDALFQDELANVRALVNKGGNKHKGKKSKKLKHQPVMSGMQAPQRQHLPMPVAELRAAVRRQRLADEN